jgi:hypothetical protein
MVSCNWHDTRSELDGSIARLPMRRFGSRRMGTENAFLMDAGGRWLRDGGPNSQTSNGIVRMRKRSEPPLDPEKTVEGDPCSRARKRRRAWATPRADTACKCDGTNRASRRRMVVPFDRQLCSAARGATSPRCGIASALVDEPTVMPPGRRSGFVLVPSQALLSQRGGAPSAFRRSSQ